MTPSQQVRPVLTLDENVEDLFAEAEKIYDAGPLVPVRIPRGPDLVYATAHRDVADEVFLHEMLSKDPEHWAAWKAGKVPEDWGLLGFVTAQSMLNADGLDHKRLRKPVARAFTMKRVRDLVPHIEQRVATLLDQIPVNEVVDLRGGFAYELPMSIICGLLGIADEDARTRLADDFDAMQDTTSPRALEAQAAIAGIMGDLIELKRRKPGDDLTTALINATSEDGSPLTDAELVSTLVTVTFAGHETTQNLITNGTRQLARHPDQLDLLLSGDVRTSWSNAVAETLRYDGSINILMFRYAREDVTIAGVTVPKGAAIMLCIAAIGRDPAIFDRAREFDVTREPSSDHRAFGLGPHHCLGAPLATVTTETALRALHTRFNIQVVDSASLKPLRSLASNAPVELPMIASHRITV